MLNAHNNSRRSVMLIGLIVLAVGLLAGCSLVPEGVRTATGQDIEVTAFFPNTAGLYTTNDVSVLGMPVGKVTKIEEQGNRVMVKFTIDKDVPVPADAKAAIVNTSIVTTRHIELSPTYSQGPKLTDGAVMRNEGLSPVSVGDLFDAVDKLVTNLSGQAPGQGPVADLMEITGGITDGNGQRLQEAINQLGSASQVVSGNGDGIVEIVKSVQELTGALVANYPKMKDFSTSINQVSEMLGRQSPGLVATLGDLNQTLANTSEFLQNNSGTIGASTGRLAALAENLSDFSRQLVETIDVAPLLFQNLSNSVSPEQGAWRAQVFLDKSLLDNEMLSQFCQAINLHKNGCRTGQLKDFGPDLGVFSALEALTK